MLSASAALGDGCAEFVDFCSLCAAVSSASAVKARAAACFAFLRLSRSDFAFNAARTSSEAVRGVPVDFTAEETEADRDDAALVVSFPLFDVRLVRRLKDALREEATLEARLEWREETADSASLCSADGVATTAAVPAFFTTFFVFFPLDLAAAAPSPALAACARAGAGVAPAVRSMSAGFSGAQGRFLVTPFGASGSGETEGTAAADVSAAFCTRLLYIFFTRETRAGCGPRCCDDAADEEREAAPLDGCLRCFG